MATHARTNLIAVLLCLLVPANSQALTLSTMMCMGNGCPQRVYAYHRCDRGFIWSARTLRCVRRVGTDRSDPSVAHNKRSQTKTPQ